MDPTANLEQQILLAREMIRQYNDEDSNGIDQDDAARLAELVLALDGWITRCGFLPAPWENCTACGGHGGSCRTCVGTGKAYVRPAGRF